MSTQHQTITLPETAVEDGFLVMVDKGIAFDSWRAEMVKVLGNEYATLINEELFADALELYAEELAAAAAEVEKRAKAKRKP